MRTWLTPVSTVHTARSLAGQLRGGGGLVLLESTRRDAEQGRYSLVAAEPMARVVWRGTTAGGADQGGADPWRALEAWLERYDLSAEEDLPFPAGGCFGCWGYGLRRFVEPKLGPPRPGDLPLPDGWWGFYDSVVVFDHEREEVWIVATGLAPDGSRSEARARERVALWRRQLDQPPRVEALRGQGWGTAGREAAGGVEGEGGLREGEVWDRRSGGLGEGAAYIERVVRAQRYIRAGDIYQVNLAQRWEVAGPHDLWEVYAGLAARSPAPFAAYLEGDGFVLASASPELFLRFDGKRVMTRPIKGTRPRGRTPAEDEVLAAALWASPKERAELVMITDLLRNDLGRVCAYGSVQVPELVRVERFAQVQHLVSTVTGTLREGMSQARALAACFPGGSVTGAPKFRAMEIIDELEPVERGPYTGCLGYLGFNGRSQLSVVIRAAFGQRGRVWYYGGAGIVADSDPAAEEVETRVKVAALREILDMSRSDCAHLASSAPDGERVEPTGCLTHGCLS